MTSARSVDPPPAAAVLPCRLSVPDDLVVPMRYAVEELVRPLGLTAGWDADDAEPGLWYGFGSPPAGWVGIHPVESTPDRLRRSIPIRPTEIRWHASSGRRVPVLFEGSLEGALDPVATAFHWLSGRQERAIRSRDQHGRFPSEAALQTMLGIERSAPVDDVRARLARALEEGGIRLYRRTWSGRPWVLCPTHDVDYTRKWRPGIIWREIVQYALLNRRRVPPPERIRRLRESMASLIGPGDPFREAIERIEAELARAGGSATWFFKAGAHGPNDVGYGLGGYVREMLARLDEAGHEIGLHPSYHAGLHPDRLGREHARLADVTGAHAVSVRSHYLRWDSALSPGLVAAAGFRIDSTLGFSDRPGFRHGTTLPFRLWDARRSRPTDVWEMPLAVMESALFNRMGAGPGEAARVTTEIMDTCRLHGGACVMLWHNTLWDESDFPGWGAHFVASLARARGAGAAILPLVEALGRWAPSHGVSGPVSPG